MKHVVFALFADTKSADAAIQRLIEEDHAYKEQFSLVVHRDAASEVRLDEVVQHSGEMAETDVKRGLAMGATLGGAAGAIIGAILAGPFGLLGAGPLAGVLFGGMAGSLYGMLGSGLVGAGLTDHTLKKLAERIQVGDVLLTVRTEDDVSERRVSELLRQHGAEIAEKSMLD
jgi:uncharacterized membrane protein